MTHLLTWYTADLPLDAGLNAGIAHCWFGTIPPFEDGNGRGARALTEVQLARADASAQRFYSLSAQLRLERNEAFGPVELAHLLGLSERTLYRRLGERAGLTPAAWLRERRLDKARQLLEAGDFGTVAAVAGAAGFVSAKHFSNLYAERFGRRPSDHHPPSR